ncbi:MAG: hypothetical protein HRU23_04905 [Gammaproteobacteria bacterium]|nr:hypothetical protein [Gammaproteobacteria bacterium]
MTQREQAASAEHKLAQAMQSTKNLAKASIFAGFFGGLALLVAILPAEYNIDPTGIGGVLGLTTLAEPAAEKQVTKSSAANFKVHNQVITVPAGVGLEYKLSVLKGSVIRYSWQATGGAVFFDFHGEPKGDTTGYFQSYTVSTANNVRGTLTAPFDGAHGWYWKNNGSSAVTIQLQVKGNYQIIGFK